LFLVKARRVKTDLNEILSRQDSFVDSWKKPI
jgi:hypothetical protein